MCVYIRMYVCMCLYEVTLAHVFEARPTGLCWLGKARTTTAVNPARRKSQQPLPPVTGHLIFHVAVTSLAGRSNVQPALILTAHI